MKLTQKNNGNVGTVFQNLKTGAKILLYVLRENKLAILIGMAMLALVTVQSLNYVVSSRKLSGTYLNWTIAQNFLGVLPTRKYVYVELNDGRTIMALAPVDWIPPGLGTTITVEERILLLGGSKFAAQ